MSASEPLQDDHVSRSWREHHVSRPWEEDLHDDDESDHHHENDVFIFQSAEETVAFIRKNPKSVEQIVYVNNVMHESYLNNDMFNEHIRYYIRQDQFQEIEPQSTNGRMWLRRIHADFCGRMDKTMANIILHFLTTPSYLINDTSDVDKTRKKHCMIL